MPHPSKRKGDRGERMVVRAARDAGLEAVRARGSDGRSLGEAETVDVMALVRSRVGSKPQLLAVVPMSVFLALLRRAGGWRE